MNKTWAVQGERSNPFMLSVIVFVAQHIGRWAGRLLLYPIVVYFLIALRPVGRHSRHYLSRVLGRPAGLVDVARHFHCFASTLLDRIFVQTGRIEVLDVQEIETGPLMHYVAQGQGCLLIGSHLGSFEILRGLARTQPALRLKILMDMQQSPMMMQVAKSLDPEMVDTIIDTSIEDTDLILRIQQALEMGYCVALLGDRVYDDERTVNCSFLGSEAKFPTSPYLLASLLKVPLILCFGLYRGANRYEIYIEELAHELLIQRATRASDVQALAQRYATRLEHYARLVPYNWFNFYDFWSTSDVTAEKVKSV